MLANGWSARFIFLIIGGFLPWNALGTRPTFTSDPAYLIDTWETEDGLPENSATAMVQTSDGYLWFGTFNGLVRFDGVKFTVLDPGNTPQLPSAGIVNLHLDRRGWLWVSTYDGLVLRDTRTGEWRSFGTKDGWRGDYVRSFAERRGGDLLLTTFDGHVLEFADGRLRELAAPGGRPGLGYLAQVDESNRWRVVQQWFVGSWDGERWAPETAVTNQFSRINGCGAARDGGSWLLAGRELLKLRQGQRISRVELPDALGNPWSLTEDSAGNLWLAAYDRGVTRVSPAGELRQWTMTNGLSYDSTRFVFEDRENNLWVGTSGGGLQRFKPRRFQSFGLERGLPERIVRCLTPAPDGSIWIATYGKGLCKLHGSVIEPMNLPGADTFFTYTQSVLTDRAGRLWVGTYGQSAWMSDTNGFHLIGADRTGGHNVSALFEDSRGRIWMASTERVAVSDGDAVRLLPNHHELVGVRCFAEDRLGVIWLSSRDGVFRLENDAPVEVRDGTAALREIGCMKADPDGTMWLGSLRAGLRCCRNGRVTTIGPEAGLPVSAVHDLLEDRQGYFWLSSNRGVARVRRSDLVALTEGSKGQLRGQLFDLSDGLPSVECSNSQQPTCARDAAGRLWFPTLKGVAMVDPAQLRLNTLPPPVQVESVLYLVPARRSRLGAADAARGAALISGRGRQGKDEHSKSQMDPRLRATPAATVRGAIEVKSQLEAPFLANLRLPAGSRRIEIHYTAPSFVAPEKVKFQVQLEGRDADWQDAGTRRVSDFEELPPGGYVFRVRAANNDGVWNETGASLAFVIEPFFWQTWPFRMAAGFSLLTSGAAAAWLAARAKLRRASERERAAQAVREIQEQMDLATDAALVGIWVWDIPRDRIWASERCKRLFGYPLDTEMTYEKFRARVHPEDRAGRDSALQRALTRNERYRFEYRVLLPEGTIRWLAGTARVEHDATGKPARMLGVSIDITERRQAEERFRLTVEASPSGIVLVNGQGQVLLVNAETEKLFGYTREELIGRTVEMLLPERFRTAHPGHRSGFFATPKARAMGAGRELFARRKDGTEFPVEIGLSPIQSAEGTLVLTAIVDITARRQAEAEAQRQRAELAHVARVSTMGELAASVAHELNQPLGAILANAEAADLFLNQDPPALDELREILADIRKDDERAGEVIRRMRGLLRKRELERQPLEVNSLVEDVLGLVSADAALRKTAIKAELSPGLPTVQGDRIHLQQVLLNLILNGMEAMTKQPSEKRRLVVRTVRAGGGTVELSVTDSGHGIEPDKLSRLFEPFYTTKPNGMGMGLSIARTIIEAHHGRIWAENDPAGGAMFRVTLPAASG